MQSNHKDDAPVPCGITCGNGDLCVHRQSICVTCSQAHYRYRQATSLCVTPHAPHLLHNHIPFLALYMCKANTFPKAPHAYDSFPQRLSGRTLNSFTVNLSGCVWCGLTASDDTAPGSRTRHGIVLFIFPCVVNLKSSVSAPQLQQE